MTHMEVHVLKHGAYTSTISQGKRIRRMMRTELSLEKIVNGAENIIFPTERKSPYQYQLQNHKKVGNPRTQPKLEALTQKRLINPPPKMRKVFQIRYEYYDTSVYNEEEGANKMSSTNSKEKDSMIKSPSSLLNIRKGEKTNSINFKRETNRYTPRQSKDFQKINHSQEIIINGKSISNSRSSLNGKSSKVFGKKKRHGDN